MTLFHIIEAKMLAYSLVAQKSMTLGKINKDKLTSQTSSLGINHLFEYSRPA
eukprot:CAMPEP_0197864240 /NCGR_PEP_ID=MMETSP1438-20131217/42335_1 /TAXON_ID=1461541 /ORGANISM="Pterosperma sp., Strain CCMP1384" /LENGTH=51 /DNA_ID=CAMNT_0043482409 /DNA_START=108 /DNA_END=259 /DNA_ORIENTATION=+